MEKIDIIDIKFVQNFEAKANIQNPVDIDIENNTLRNFIARNNRTFNVSTTNDTKIIFITCNGLNNA